MPKPTTDITKLKASFWKAACDLRTNPKLTSSNYFIPILGVIFLRHNVLVDNIYNYVYAWITAEPSWITE